MELALLKNKEIHVIGIAGTEGSSIALFLIKHHCRRIIGHNFSKKADFKKNYLRFHQDQPLPLSLRQLKKIQSHLNKIYYQKNYLCNLKKAEVIFAPSSYLRYPHNQPLKQLEEKKIFLNWYNLILNFYQGTLIGVTGTAGKGTTTNLIHLILKEAKLKSWLVGDSWQMIDLSRILNAQANSYLVAELSNRTLGFAKYSKKSPAIAVITNITKNHLEDHQGSFKKYILTKKEIAKYQTSKDALVLNGQDQQTKKLKLFGKSKKIFYTINPRERRLIKNKNIYGEHLISDALAAIKVAKILKIPERQIIKGLNKFKPRKGRMQFIAKINNISFINDAVSTRPEATMAAIKSFAKNKINLILEGSRVKPDKSQYRSIVRTINRYRVKRVAVSGTITNFLSPLLAESSAQIFKTKNLTDSVKTLAKLAADEEIVLLSPGAESFGEFKDYRERMSKFNQIIQRLNR